MSSKYNRFLLSTCLPVMALGLCLSAPSAHAGFEWTPPEKTEPVKVMPAPEMDIPEPVAVDPVMSETLEDTAMEVEVEMEEPPIAITVIEEEMVEPEPVEEEIATEVDIEDVEIVVIEEENAPEEIVKIAEEPAQEEMIEVVEETIQEEIIIVEDEKDVIEDVVVIEEEVIVEEQPIESAATEHPQEKIVIEAMDVENSPAPIKDMPAKSENASAQSLTINPYPLEEEEKLAKVEPKEVIHWNTPETFDVIEGFGSDMPLALALRQIVPPQYAFSFGDGVNAGMRISWQGGNPWNQVLSDALAPHGVATSVNNKKVLLRLAETTEAESSTAANTAPEMAEEAHPAFEADVASIDKVDVTEEAVEEISEDVSEMAKDVEETVEDNVDAVQDAEQAPEEAMNDALKEVYGDEASEEPILDTEPLNMDAADDKGASNSMVEELLEPIEMTAEEEDVIPTPDMDKLSQTAEEAEENIDAVVQRVGIKDPGPVESTQPMASDLEKKN